MSTANLAIIFYFTLPVYDKIEIEMERPIFIRDVRRKEKFVVDDAYLNGYVRTLSPEATLTYLVLCRHSDQLQKSFPSTALIAEKIGRSRRMVANYIRELRTWNIISVEKVRSENGKWLGNQYYLLDKSVWKESPIYHHGKPTSRGSHVKPSALTTPPWASRGENDFTGVAMRSPFPTKDIKDTQYKESDFQFEVEETKKLLREKGFRFNSPSFLPESDLEK